MHTYIHTYIHTHTHSHTYIYIYVCMYVCIYIYTYTQIQRERERYIYASEQWDGINEKTCISFGLIMATQTDGQWRNHPISDVKDPCPKLNRPKDREAANEWFIVHISPHTTGAYYPSEFVWQFLVVLIQKSCCTRDVIRLMDHVSCRPSHRHSQKPTRGMSAEVCVLLQGNGIEDMIFKTSRH